jgi:hypothetical protein
VETRTSGAEGGPGKRARRNPGTAPRPDPYVFAVVAGRYTATAKFSTHDVLAADDPEQLLTKIRQHYPGPSERSST